MAKQTTAISPTRAENYPEWYQQVTLAAELAEASGVRGCMVIKPWGLSIWENIRKILDPGTVRILLGEGSAEQRQRRGVLRLACDDGFKAGLAAIEDVVRQIAAAFLQ